MKKVFFCLGLMLVIASPVVAQDWKDNPSNWNNNSSNWQNNPSNWENNPSNWNNSQSNPKANLIYDNEGHATGYVVPKSNGSGVNIFDFSGKNKGYYNY